MVKPMDLQDNLSKTLIAQKMAEQSHEGAERLKQSHQELALQKMEERQKNQAKTLGEKPGMEEVSKDSPDQKDQRGKKGRKRKKKDDSSEDLNDLRKRREEDDKGKGSRLDVKG